MAAGHERRRRARRSLLGLVLMALAGDRAAAAGDCLGPLGDNLGWSCSAALSSGTTVDYCLQLTNTFGADPAERFFKLNVTGPFPRTCSCGAKGKAPGARYGEAADYLCLDRATDTVESGKISRKKITGQTFNVSQNLRSKFSCKVDPTCVLPPVIDPDLTSSEGSLPLGESSPSVEQELTLGGPVDLSALPGCRGFASEEPDFVVDFTAFSSQFLVFVLGAPGVEVPFLVVSPSGEMQCDLGIGVAEIVFVSPPSGPYRVWGATLQSGGALVARLFAFLRP